MEIKFVIAFIINRCQTRFSTSDAEYPVRINKQTVAVLQDHRRRREMVERSFAD